MARDEQHTPPDDSIGAATRALADATATLTRMLGKQVHAVVPEVGEALAASLREASRSLADASETVGRRGGSRPGDDRRRQKADRTRADLLDAAARVIAAHGYEGASVGDIAAEAGYTKGAVYAHFGSKSEVFLALAREQMGLGGDAPETVLPGLTADGVDERVLTAWLEEAADDPRVLLSLEFLSYGLRNPDASAELAELHCRSFDVLAEQVAEIRRTRRRARGEQAEEGVTEEDRDVALAVVSVANIGTLEGKLTGSPHLSPRACARVIGRLLDL